MFSTDMARKICVIFIFLCIAGMFAFFLSYRFLNHYLVITKPLERADAIVLMAGNDTRRLSTVADLYHRGLAPTVLLTNDGIFSAWSNEYSRNLYQVEWAQLELMKSGVPKNAIVKLKFTQSGTFYDALNQDAVIETGGLDYNHEREIKSPGDAWLDWDRGNYFESRYASECCDCN